MGRPPDLCQELVVRDHLACMADQHRQQFIFDRSKMHFLVIEKYLPLGEIDPKIVDGKDRLCCAVFCAQYGEAPPGSSPEAHLR